jgi:hypothetical protein
MPNPNNGTAICTCKLGYAINNITHNCTGMISQTKQKNEILLL